MTSTKENDHELHTFDFIRVDMKISLNKYIYRKIIFALVLVFGLKFLQRKQHQIALENNVKPWFFKNGRYPKTMALHKELKGEGAFRPNSKLFPFQDPHSDRIVNQLMYVPPDYEEIKSSGKLKTILLENSSESLYVQEAGMFK